MENSVQAQVAPVHHSAFAPLREPLFRSLWIAAVISYTGSWMQNIATAWPWFRRGGARASPEAPWEHHGFPFACECGRRGCGDTVQLTIEEFDTTPQVLAHA